MEDIDFNIQPKYSIGDMVKTYDGSVVKIRKINRYENSFEYVFRDKYGELCWVWEDFVEGVEK